LPADALVLSTVRVQIRTFPVGKSSWRGAASRANELDECRGVRGSFCPDSGAFGRGAARPRTSCSTDDFDAMREQRA